MLSVVVERVCPPRTSPASHSLRCFLRRRTSIRIDVSSSSFIFSHAAAFPGGFDQEGATAPGPDNRVYFLHQIVGQQDMSAFAFHGRTFDMCLVSVS